jgi:hypothetical protein
LVFNARKAAITALLAFLGIMLVLWNACLICFLVWSMPPNTAGYNDYCRFHTTAAAYWQGEAMYSWHATTPAKVKDREMDMWNMNPPHFHLLIFPLVPLPMNAGFAIYALVSVVCLVASLRILATELNLKPAPRTRQFYLLGLLAFCGMNALLMTGQLTWLLMLPVVLGWRAARRSEWGWAGIFLGVSMSLKPFLLILLPYLVFKKYWNGAISCALATAGCFSLGVIVFGVEEHRAWIEGLGKADGWAWLPMNGSLWGFLTRNAGPSLFYYPALVVSTAALKWIWLSLGSVIGVITLLAAVGDRSEQQIDRAFALLLVASLLLSPLGWTYYFWLPLAPVVALFPRWLSHSGLTVEPLRDRSVWSRRLIWASVPGLLCPLQLTGVFQPWAGATAIFASIYFWSLMLVWLALILDAWAANRTRLPWLTQDLAMLA